MTIPELTATALFVRPSLLAKRLGCTSKSVRERLRKGTIKGKKIGKTWHIYRAEYNRLIAEEETPK